MSRLGPLILLLQHAHRYNYTNPTELVYSRSHVPHVILTISDEDKSLMLRQQHVMYLLRNNSWKSIRIGDEDLAFELNDGIFYVFINDRRDIYLKFEFATGYESIYDRKAAALWCNRGWVPTPCDKIISLCRGVQQHPGLMLMIISYQTPVLRKWMEELVPSKGSMI